MGNVTRSSSEVYTSDSEKGFAINHSTPPELDAGAKFVLVSRGSWLHCGYHLTTSIVAPVLLTLPFSFTLLGWVGGVLWLTLAAVITFYSYNLLSVVLEYHAQLGRRQFRFRDMAKDILGPGWAKYYVGPLQFAICFGTVIGGPLVGGKCLKLIYYLYYPEGSMKLYQFITICGVITLILAQLPSFHSLRHVNMISLILSVLYATCLTIGSIYIGHSKDAPPRHYSVRGSDADQLFGVFNGISIIATTYASGIIPEIQATLAAPVKGKMLKGLCVCYSVIATTYFSVAISGYWAFGNDSDASVLSNFFSPAKKPLLPKWFFLMTNIFILLQVMALTAVYLQPTNEIFEATFGDPKMGQFSMRNVVPRVVLRSVAVAAATVLAAMLPFFPDIMALFGAFGCIPLDFILPMVFYNMTFKPSKNTIIFWVNTLIAGASSILVVIGGIASIRQIVLDAKTYNLFADL
ncbi:GABA transporter 1-like [Vigna umbellata]|uniref:GABA transporter 1-like n=2 Tax=Vigna umbellata TaxID=87088 RepID=UPI001F5EF66C|nr:GABA transporter 1-like [Vigna umbellata]XP_047176517.1 GABA transporter 1-like [Vigna umbellata]